MLHNAKLSENTGHTTIHLDCTTKAKLYYPRENEQKNLYFDLNVPYPVPVTSNLYFSASSTQPLHFVTSYVKQK